MKPKIHLSETHRRVVSVVLKFVERGMDEITDTLNNPTKGTSYETSPDIEPSEIPKKLETIKKVKNLVAQLYGKYDLHKDNTSQSAIIRAKKNTLWSILEDTYSRKLKNYGTFDEHHAEEFDKQIKKLIDLIEVL